MVLLDKKTKEEIDRHKSNPYRKGLSSRKPVGSDCFFSLENIVSDHSLFYVPIDKFSGFEGHYYYSGKDPLVITTQELIANPKLNLIDSYLFKYYKSFQPKTYGEVYQLDKSNKLHSLPQTSFFHPWIHSTPTNIFRAGLFGPKDITNVEHRILRLGSLIKNVCEFGYIPSSKDIVEGYILLKNDDYRFLITGGHHRIAVMSALHMNGSVDFDNILVKYETNRSNVKIVDISKSNNWPGVRSGFLKREDAEEMFNAYFI